MVVMLRLRQPWFLLCLSCLFALPLCHSQSNQNIETFFPSVIPTPTPSRAPTPSPRKNPPVPSPSFPPRESPSPTTSQPIVPHSQSQPSPASTSSKNDVAKAVAVTAASTLVVTGLAFILIRRYVLARRRKENYGNGSNGSQGVRSSAVVPHNDQLGRHGGDSGPKGFIVDENGLDVLYWRKLESNNDGGGGRGGDVDGDDEEKGISGREGDHDEDRRKNHMPIQEVPLLRGKSSSSHIKDKPEGDDSNGNYRIMSLHAVEKTEPQSSNPPPPPPPIVAGLSQKSPVQPPPPPPPPQVGAKKSPPPPPPPQVGAKKGPVPPPPPLKGRSLNSLSKPPSGKKDIKTAELDSGKGSGQVKLKPLHWDKVNMANADHSMVWDKLNDGGSFRFDGDLMEALFGCVATNRSPRINNKNAGDSSSSSGPSSAQIFILETRKSQNIAIVLKSLSLSRKEILEALMEGKGINADTLEKLVGIAPTDEEEAQILDYKGDPTKLADAECFNYHILKAVPSAFSRLNAMLFRATYDSEILNLKESIQTLELGSQELRARGLFMKLLEAVLKAGNRMNAGTSRGNAQAFNLSALRKLSDVRSTDGKTTLLHFVVEEVVRSEGKRCVLRKRSLNRSSSHGNNSGLSSENLPSKEDREKEYVMLGLPVVGGLSSEFSNVKKAATIDCDSFAGGCSDLTKRAAEIRQLVSQRINENGGGFVREMKGFLDTAEKELKVVREEQTRVMELVKKTTEYYQAGAFKDKGAHPLQLFVIVKDFLAMVDQACVQIARNLQKKRGTTTANGGSSSPPSRVSVRFPMLPDNFMLEKSRSNSSESDNDI
ncbi:hypothetical protein FNV43_RR26076 [Rhamnella rubrinervis]|uniref:Formin-like protein n=1 Tax=Rhamnella rubrinervis TaxID=2594499 RepID=A0A8K0DI57_9ROSA|nr:hypothetical protein FNV43_RR26076 [Rhamnella rubrinervis]